ncbi:hypothetical protein LPJ70_004061 [Coemansia sp. RSA 2708]|nr:hypothetical protein LPJ70_004061 [Coemansia sp. RSA 2708]
MEAAQSPSPQPQVARVQGLNNIIVPPDDTLYQAWQVPDTPPGQAPPLYPMTRNGLIEKPDYSSLVSMAPQPNKKSWWVRLLVDSMLVPFVQGFMLNLGIHWVKYWRRSGGLLGVFRGRFGSRRAQPMA